jgi:hypothetical protein
MFDQRVIPLTVPEAGRAKLSPLPLAELPLKHS